MLGSIFLAVAFASVTFTSPLNKRDLVIVTDVVTDVVVVTETVAPDAPAISAPATVYTTAHASEYKSLGSAPASGVKAAPSSSSVAAYAPASSVGAASSKPSDFPSMVVDHHNVHRANHSAFNLVWNTSLAETAEKIAASCYYGHNIVMDGGGYGQNIAAGAEPNNISGVITDSFYNGEIIYFGDQYGRANPDMVLFERWGHFSQIVWKATSSVGCAVQDCSAKGLGNVGSNVPPYFTVCNYYPAGNIGTEYGDNIGEPLGYPSVNYDTFGLVNFTDVDNF
ncbi:MAG: hypothetical protein M1820_010565 [Bogoriella megaspora]|nr:MAG: hypothetical protein M1820_010565 [Bogoriella megaspora]